MRDAKTIATRIPADKKVFEGFPYLVTRIVDALHHVLLLPRSWDAEQLIAVAQKQVRANKLPTCLVLAGDLCVYLREDGRSFRSNSVPLSPNIALEKLLPAEPVPESDELAIRRMELILREESRRGDGGSFIMGDLTKGGRLPTPEEEERLAGTHAGNVPNGLLPCPCCGEWRGECFDSLLRELVVRVHCLCENDNRCAACGELLHCRKLNANHFDPLDGKICHTPAFCGFHHRCKVKTEA